MKGTSGMQNTSSTQGDTWPHLQGPVGSNSGSRTERGTRTMDGFGRDRRVGVAARMCQPVSRA